MKNRTFNSNWTELYFFTEDVPNNRPLCLVCQGTAAVHKAAKIKRHAEFVKTYPLGTMIRAAS